MNKIEMKHSLGIPYRGRNLVPLVLLALFAASSNCVAGLVIPSGGDYTYSGNTCPSTSSDGFFCLSSTFNRPVANGDLQPDTLSDTAYATPFDTLTFQVEASGNFNVTITPDPTVGWSSYLFLYQTAFDPTQPLSNVLLGESNSDGTSNLNTNLFSGTIYVAVVAGFANFDWGSYAGEIQQVSLAPAPETSTFALTVGGIVFALGCSRLRRRGSAREQHQG